MKNIDQMNKKELAHKIFLSKLRNGKQSLVDKYTKPELKAMFQKEVKNEQTKKPVTKAKAVKQPKKALKKKAVRKTTKRTTKKK